MRLVIMALCRTSLLPSTTLSDKNVVLRQNMADTTKSPAHAYRQMSKSTFEIDEIAATTDKAASRVAWAGVSTGARFSIVEIRRVKLGSCDA